MLKYILMTDETGSNTNETVILATGNISPDQRADLLQALTQFGMNAYVIGPEANPDIDNPLPPKGESPHYHGFADLTTRQHFLGYEHIRDFQTKYEGEFKPRMIHSVFSALVMPREARHGGKGNMGSRVDPATLGLVVSTREAVGFPKLPHSLTMDKDKEIVERVVQVGSVINYGRLLKNPSFARDKKIEGMTDLEQRRPKLVMVLVEALQAQVKKPPRK